MLTVNIEASQHPEDLDIPSSATSPIQAQGDDSPPEYEQITREDIQNSNGNVDNNLGDRPEGVVSVQLPKIREPRPNAQRAYAPVSVHTSNSRILEDYIVILPKVSSGPEKGPSASQDRPDIHIKTSNGMINSTVFLRQAGNNGQTITPSSTISRDTSPSSTQPNVEEANSTTYVRVETSNGQVITGFPEKGNLPVKVDYTAKTSNGRIEAELPKNFRGVLTAQTSNAKVVLEGPVKANSAIIANPPGSSDRTVSYWITPANPSAFEDQGQSHNNGSSVSYQEKTRGQDSTKAGNVDSTSRTVQDSSNVDLDIPSDIYDVHNTFDRCHLQTSNGGITVSYWQPENERGSSDSNGQNRSSGCVIA